MVSFSNKKHSLIKITAILFIITGIYFRFWDFGPHNFNGDESAHMRKAVSVTRGVLDFIKGERITGWQNIYLTVLQHNHPPLEFLLIIPAVPFKNRELIARIIYLSLNILFLIISYFISKKVINNKFALYLLAILSTSTYFIWTSRFVTHDSISIIVSTLIGLAIIYFYKTNNLKKALFFLFLCLTIGLYSFIDFVLYLPIITLILYDRLKSNGVKPYLRPIVIFLIINCLFYVPYVFYSFIPNVPQSAGFNYYLNSKSNVLSLNLLKNLGIFYKDFFSKSGVFPIWLFALFGAFSLRKYKFIKYFAIIILTFLLINLIKLTTANFYMEFYGLIVIMGVLWLTNIGRIGMVLLSVVIILNLYGNIAILHNDYSQATGPIIPASDKLKLVGNIAKSCLVNNESYISTVNPWRTFYYFGRPVLPGIEGNLWTAKEAIELYARGELRNEVFLIHFKEEEIPEELDKNLEKIAKRKYVFEKDRLLIFKECDI